MKTRSEMLKDLWIISRSRLTELCKEFKNEQLGLRLHPDSNSMGFLLTHIGETELLFGKAVFGFDANAIPKTFGKKYTDNELFSDLTPILALLEEADTKMIEAISKVEEDKWDTIVTTPIGPFGLSDAFGRIISHTNYHLGQIGLIMKYGK
ncbi:MAG: DinB family protein [bacterium]